MDAELKGIIGDWIEVASAARTTIGVEEGSIDPSSEWKKRILLAEHSPIRTLSFSVLMKDIKYWVSVHLVRHKFGIEHFVKTQRSDRTGIPRGNLPQGALVDHRIHANAQAIINISRKRLCRQASAETREAWQAVLDAIKDHDPEVFSACVPDCIYRGWCYELKPCGYHRSEEYRQRLKAYRSATAAAKKSTIKVWVNE